jgi:sugar lactone lactonase YvrE
MRALVIGTVVIGLASAGTLLLPTPAQAAEGVKLRVAAAAYRDAKGAIIGSPEGIACRGGGLVVLADTGSGRLLEFQFDATGVSARREFSVTQITTPIRVASNSKGELYVLDGKTRRVARLAAEGAFQRYVEFPGSSAAAVRSIEVGTKDQLYILDVAAARVVVLDDDGKLERELAFPPEAKFFSDLAANSKGDLFLLDSVGRRVFAAKSGTSVITPLSQSLQDDVDFPVAIAADDAGKLFLADQNGGGIVTVGQDGAFRGRQSSMGWHEGFLRYPSDLCADDKGNLFVADRDNNRIQGFIVAH